jgi:plasmid stability protein
MLSSAIQVKNVPENLHEALRRRAARVRDLALPSEAEWLEELRAQPTMTGLPPLRRC